MPESRIKVMRMKEMITNLSSQKLKKFLLLAPWEQYEEYTYWFKGVNGWSMFLEFLTTGDQTQSPVGLILIFKP